MALGWDPLEEGSGGFIEFGVTLVASFGAKLLFCSAWSHFGFAATEFLDSTGMEVPFDSDVSLGLPDFTAVIQGDLDLHGLPVICNYNATAPILDRGF